MLQFRFLFDLGPEGPQKFHKTIQQAIFKCQTRTSPAAAAALLYPTTEACTCGFCDVSNIIHDQWIYSTTSAGVKFRSHPPCMVTYITAQYRHQVEYSDLWVIHSQSLCGGAVYPLNTLQHNFNGYILCHATFSKPPGTKVLSLLLCSSLNWPMKVLTPPNSYACHLPPCVANPQLC